MIIDLLLDSLLDALLDTAKLLPFLYLTYLLMELLERRAGEKTEAWIARSGKAGPAIGALLGALPQCGFSAAGAGLYAGRVITAGTVLAVFWSTSDEMLPILLSSHVEPLKILKILAIKVVFALIAGFAVDLLHRVIHKNEQVHLHIGELCEAGHCHCDGHSIWYAALIHTSHIVLAIFCVSLGLNIVLGALGADALGTFLAKVPLLSSLFAALVGLLPNCAASVAITQLYLEGVLSAGAMLAGLLTGAGVGLLVLFRANKPVRDSVRLTAILFFASVFFGILFDLIGLGNLMGL